MTDNSRSPHSGIMELRVPGGEWTDAYDSYGILLDDMSIANLMTPAPAKEHVENESDLQNGKRVTRNPSYTRKEDRDVTVVFSIWATDRTDLMSKYAAFCTDILDKGFLDIRTRYQDGVVYRMTYLRCTELSEYMEGGYAKFTLTLNEPDPANRGVTDRWEEES